VQWRATLLWSAALLAVGRPARQAIAIAVVANAATAALAFMLF
jgi:hypothetical protein